MLVCTLKYREDASRTVFEGDLEECREYCRDLKREEYQSIHICDNTGLIVDHVYDAPVYMRINP